MNSYEMKQAARRDRLENAADNAERESNASYKRSKDLVSCIPFGQPILVGHHSERGHRNRLDKSWNAMGKSVALDKKAKDLRYKAAAVGTAGISSDDPGAAGKIRAKIETLEKQRELMKAGNKAYRMAVKRGINGLPSDELQVKDVDEIRAAVKLGSFDFIKTAIQWAPKYGYEKGPFVGYQLQNLGQNITRYKKRLAGLADKPTETTTETVGEVQIIQNADANRVQIFFPDKPSAETRTSLKRNGFRWAPSVGAWQRHLNSRATYLAHQIVQEAA